MSIPKINARLEHVRRGPDRRAPPRVKHAKPVCGVWLRTSADGILEVLVEVVENGAPVWRLLRSGGECYTDGAISHIWEVAGINKAPLDPLGDS